MGDRKKKRKKEEDGLRFRDGRLGNWFWSDDFFRIFAHQKSSEI